MKTKLNITGGLTSMRSTGMIATETGNVRFIAQVERHGEGGSLSKEDEANGHLISQAFNVANRTGLMPEELERQRDACAVVLQACLDRLNCANDRADRRKEIGFMTSDVEKLLAEIKGEPSASASTPRS